MIKETEKIVESSLNQIVDNEMKKEFMRYAMLENPRTGIGKIVATAFKKFREWWEIYRRPKVTREARESVLKRLKQNEEAIESAHAMLDNKNKGKEYER